jgi:hypothetical protein
MKYLQFLLIFLLLCTQSSVSLAEREPFSQFLFSNDQGKTFQEIKTPFKIVDIMMAHDKGGGILGITDKGKLIRSLNDGRTWKVIKSLGVQCTDNDHCNLFETPKGTILIYSGYAGKHFIRVGNQKITGLKFDWVENMHVTPLGDILIVVGTNGAYPHVFISKDDGVTWKRYFDKDHDSGVYVSPKGTLFIRYSDLQNDKYFRLSRDKIGGDDLPFSRLHIRSLPSGKIWAVGTREHEKENYFISDDDGLTWQPLVRQDEIRTLLEKDGKSTLIITERGGKIVKCLSKSAPTSRDDFLIACRYLWSPTDLHCFESDHDLPDEIEGAWRKCFGIHDTLHSEIQKGADGTYFLVNAKGFYRSGDNGQSWEKPISSYLPVQTGKIKILIGPNRSGKVYLNWVKWPDI